jgi:hypothetical protein
METVCDRILATDKRIGFAMIVNHEGHIVESKVRGRLLMPQEDIAALAGVWTIIIGGVGKQMEKYFGRFEVNLLAFEKVAVYGVTLNERTIVISARKDLPLETVHSLKKIAEE